MLLTIKELELASGKGASDNMVSVLRGLQKAGVGAGLERPHRLAMFLAQLMHESAGFRYDREIWGPTKAQMGYEGRKDLGNTQAGDGKKFAGHTAMQITGRANTAKFLAWCRALDAGCPDFLLHPELMNTDPWEGLGPIWYWTKGKSTSLNTSADKGDFLANTKAVNGGDNGLKDRYRYYGRAALVLLGYAPGDLATFQKAHGLTPDGECGPKTAAVLHRQLTTLPPVSFNAPSSGSSISKTSSQSGGVLGYVGQIIEFLTKAFWR